MRVERRVTLQLSRVTLCLAIVAMLIATGCGQSVATSERDAPTREDEAPAGPRTPTRAGSAGASPSQASPSNSAGTITDESWTSFRNGPQQLGIAHTTLPDNLELLWEHAAKDGMTSTAAIAGGRVYAGILGGNVLCLDLRTGDDIWSYRSIESADPEEFAPGFAAPVTVTEALVLAGDEDGILHILDRATGKLRWKYPTGGEIVGGATVVGDSVIFGSHGGRLFRLKLADGSLVWEFDTSGPVNASQAIGEQHTFVTGCDQPVLRVVDIETGEQHSEVELQGLLIATPALLGDMLYFGTDEGSVFAVDWKSGQTVWTYADPNRSFQIHSSPAVTDDLVIIGSDDKRLHAINRKTGKPVWTFATRAGIDGSPVVAGDRVYFGSGDKYLYGLTIADGKQVWKYPAGQSFTGSPAVGEGHLVIGTDASQGRILCFGKK